jgi:hypothetical protein
VFQDVNDFLNADVEAVLIATPISRDYDLARRALLAGKHEYVEKLLGVSPARKKRNACLDHGRRFQGQLSDCPDTGPQGYSRFRSCGFAHGAGLVFALLLGSVSDIPAR